MSRITVDAVDQLCPKPIIMTKKAVESARPGDEIEIFLNREQSKNNTVRFLEDNNIPVRCEQKGDIFTLYITKAEVDITTTISKDACSITGCGR